ncbi:MAG: tyrosine-type recombinase/integrase [Vampirovibrionales bacterium]|nr:tyrosine-type recombinase/integrase [Vampirovibrionales bacterium]
MMQVHVSTLKEASKLFNISRTELYNRINSGKLLVETFYRDSKRAYKIYQTTPELALVPDQPRPKTPQKGAPGIEGGDVAVPKQQAFPRRGMHAQYIPEWLKWYEDGVDVNAWAASHRKDQLHYINKYFDRFDVILATHLRVWLAEVDKNRVTLRRHMHGAVSSFARFLCESKELLNDSEREEIRRLYPKVPRGFKHQQKILQREDIPIILKACDKASGDDAYKQLLFRTLIILLSTTALRLSEVCSLQFSSLRFHEDVTKAALTVIGKGSKERMVPFPKMAQQAILDYLKVRPKPEQQNELAPNALFWVHSQRYGYTTLKNTPWSLTFVRSARRVGLLFCPLVPALPDYPVDERRAYQPSPCPTLGGPHGFEDHSGLYPYSGCGCLGFGLSGWV